ncbi:MAG TPA: SAM-dependent chlorinase/fluorinase [Gemmatimonadaceae bacterium]
MIITLLTDFGTADGYVGEMKGVLLSEVPGATIIDITHDIPPHDVELGRLTLARYWRRFPPGTVHIAVVDPGVGSERAALLVASDGSFLVGPDNGLLSPALLVGGARAVALGVPSHASATFHGRDVFAPAAAQLARGVDVDALGAPAAAPVILRTAEPHRGKHGELIGEVIAVDRFGNAITNLVGIRGGQLRVHDREIPVQRAYADLESGEIGAVVGSTGLIEIVVREGRAADVLSLPRGTKVTLR